MNIPTTVTSEQIQIVSNVARDFFRANFQAKSISDDIRKFMSESSFFIKGHEGDFNKVLNILFDIQKLGTPEVEKYIRKEMTENYSE